MMGMVSFVLCLSWNYLLSSVDAIGNIVIFLNVCIAFHNYRIILSHALWKC